MFVDAIEDGQQAGPSDSRTKALDSTDMDMDTDNLEDFLKGIMGNDPTAEEAAAGIVYYCCLLLLLRSYI